MKYFSLRMKLDDVNTIVAKVFSIDEYIFDVSLSFIRTIVVEF